MTAPELLCWCCAVWGLTTPAIVADKRLCARCLNSKPAECGRHLHRWQEQALGITPEPQPDLFTSPHP